MDAKRFVEAMERRALEHERDAEDPTHIHRERLWTAAAVLRDVAEIVRDTSDDFIECPDESPERSVLGVEKPGGRTPFDLVE